MKPISAFQAEDGTLFTTQEGASEYEAALAWHNRIEAFAESPMCPYPHGAQRGMMPKIIVAWERWKAEHPQAATRGRND